MTPGKDKAMEKHKPGKLSSTKAKEDTIHFLHKYGPTKGDKLCDRAHMSTGMRQTGRFVSIRVPGV